MLMQKVIYIYIMHDTDSRFVTGPETILFAHVYVWTFQLGKVRGRGGEGVNGAVTKPSMTS